MEVMQVLHMNKGEDETSYAKNSLVQRKIISIGNAVVKEAVVNILMNGNFPESIGIADLGCSSGPNALTVVSAVIDIVCSTARQKGLPAPELRISLNDLPGNDFNDVFMSLPGFYKKLHGVYGIERCFVSGMPGSFYGRLFPNNSLHFVHSSSSLHWLSQVPPEVGADARVNLIKGKLFISKSSPKIVLEAYHRQFQDDFSLFLKSRSQEIVGGGRMVLLFMGRNSSDPSSPESCFHWELLAHALMSLASDGLVDEEKIDSFNAPYYAPCPEEVKLEVAKEGSFLIDRFESFEIDWDGGEHGDLESQKLTTMMPEEGFSRGERVAKTIRAVVESMLECHFGMGACLMDELFRRFSVIVDDHFSKTRLVYFNLVISLIRN